MPVDRTLTKRIESIITDSEVTIPADGFISEHDYLTIAEIPSLSLFNDYTLALGLFLDDFYSCDLQNKALALRREPEKGILTMVQYCKLAAAAHKLANDYALPVPKWTMKGEYTMPYPVYAFGSDNIDFHELLKESTPDEYKIRNLFLGPGVLKRV